MKAEREKVRNFYLSEGIGVNITSETEEEKKDLKCLYVGGLRAMAFANNDDGSVTLTIGLEG